MSLPKFPDEGQVLTLDQSINLIITSIAMEEQALSNILEAECEKIEFVIETLRCNCCEDTDSIIEINSSVESLVEKITDMQIVLKNKLDTTLNFSGHIHNRNNNCCCEQETPCDSIENAQCSNEQKRPQRSPCEDNHSFVSNNRFSEILGGKK